LPVLTGIVIWLVFAELKTVTQFVPSPWFKELVCICKLQPVWSAGQFKFICPALMPKPSCGTDAETGRALA
jgi:hypothetical protein